MEVNHLSDSPNKLTDEPVLDALKKTDKHDDISQPSSLNPSTEPRKRSYSLLNWMQKNLTTGKSSHTNHEHSPSRQRSATAAHGATNRRRRSPPITQPIKSVGRPRASTVGSIGSTDKRVPPPKKIISDTDDKAQQSPSIFQFVFGR